MTKTEMWSNLLAGKRVTRFQFFGWLADLEEAAYQKGLKRGEQRGYERGYTSGKQDGKSCVRDNY